MTATLEMKDKVAVIRLDDGKRNAVNHALLDGLNGALDEAEAKGARCVVLMGRDGTFSAGFDLKFFATCTPEEMTGLVLRGSQLTTRLLQYPMPVIAACTGHGIAMGAFTLLSCDFRYGVDDDQYRIGANETAIKMILPVFGFELAKARLNPLEKARAIAEGHLYTPKEAVKAGFLDEVVSADKLEETVLKRAEHLAQLSSKSFAGNRIGIWKETIDAIEASHTSGGAKVTPA